MEYRIPAGVKNSRVLTGERMTGQKETFHSEAESQTVCLTCPIYAMYLIHKALKSEAAQVEEMVRLLEDGDSLQPVRAAFNFWATALAFHAQQEDEHMTALMPDFEPVGVNETEHAALDPIISDITSKLDSGDNRGLAERVKDLVAALHEEQHLQLFDLLEDVMAVPNQEIGRTKVVARTHRHRYQSVVALRVAQDDHLECEEEFVLPTIRDTFEDSRQISMVRSLLIDDLAEDKGWVLDWVCGHLSTEERQFISNLEIQLQASAVMAN